MKRMGLVFALIMVLIVMAAPARAAESKTFARHVPDGAVLYATTQGLEEFWAGIERSNFWAMFTHLKVWEGADFSWYDDFRDEFADELGFEFNTANLMAVFGKEFAVAFYAEPGEDGGNPTIEVVFVSRMNPPELVQEIVDKLLERAKAAGDDEVTISSVDHDGVKVQTIKTDDDDPPLQLRWAMKDDVFIVGIGNRAARIEACLDCMAGAGTPLTANAEYAKLIGQASQAEGRFFGEVYFSMSTLKELLGSLMAESPDMEPFGNMIDMMTGSTKAMAMTTHLDRGLRIKAAVEPGPAVAEMMTLVHKAAPSAGTHAKYIPPEVLIYYGANSMPPLGEMWPHMMKMYADTGVDEMINDVILQIELALDIDFEEDLLGNIGTEMAVMLEGLDMEAGPFPFPKLTILLQIQDKAKSQAFIDKLVGLIEEAVPPEMGLMVNELTHEGAELKVVEIPMPFMQMTLTPTIGTTENFLFISSGEDYAKATLEAAKGGTSLLNLPLYRSLGIPEKTNGLAFINMGELMKVGREVTDWAVTMAEMHGAGEETKAQVDENVLPLLECFSALKAIAVYSVVTPEASTSVFILRTEDLPAQ